MARQQEQVEKNLTELNSNATASADAVSKPRQTNKPRQNRKNQKRKQNSKNSNNKQLSSSWLSTGESCGHYGHTGHTRYLLRFTGYL